MAERRGGDLPARVEWSEQGVGGHADVVEENLGEVGGTVERDQRTGLDARQPHVDDEAGDALVLGRLRIGAHVQLAPVGAVPERRPDLLTVHHEVVAVADGAGAKRRQVGACLGLRHALTPDVVGAHHAGQQRALLVIGSVVHDRRSDVVHADHVERHGSSRSRHLLGVDQLLEHRRAAAAVFLRPGHRTPPGVGHRRIPRRAVCRRHRGHVRGACRRPSHRRSGWLTATSAAPCGTAPPPPDMRSPRCPVRDRADWHLYNFR